MADKLFDEDELKSLEREIDAAVDRLFVEKGKKAFLRNEPEPTLSYPPELKRDGVERQIEPLSATVANPIEKLESQILSLEWEVSRDNIGKTLEEVLLLRRGYKEVPEISNLLERMVALLNVMLGQEPNIRPPLIRLLLDAMETLKLLLRKDGGGEIAIYQRLAQAGIEARFASLEEFQGERAPLAQERAGGSLEKDFLSPVSERLEEILKRLGSLTERFDRLSDQMGRHIKDHEKRSEGNIPPRVEKEGLLKKTRATIFQIGEQLFGVESHSVINLLKAPASFCQRMNHHKTFRFKEVDVKWIDLGVYFPIFKDHQDKERQLLILKEDHQYKAIMMDRVVSRLYGSLHKNTEMGNYVLGTMHWTYGDFPVHIPIIDISKL